MGWLLSAKTQVIQQEDKCRAAGLILEVIKSKRLIKKRRLEIVL